MPESIDNLRKTHARLAGHRVGLDPNQARLFTGQQRAARLEGDILAFPWSLDQLESLQVVTNGAPGFGQFRFMAGLSVLGGPDVIG